MISLGDEPKLELPTLVGDIGGTNARFQLIVDAESAPVSFENVRTESFENIEAAIHETVLARTDVKPKTAILAAAGPITKDGLNLTNCHWNIEPETFLNAGTTDELVLMNDFEAQALSLPFLGPDDLAPLGDVDGSLAQDRTKVVLGPGTGLGVGLLVRAADQWIPVAGEGGHVDLGPRNTRERAIWDHMETVEGRISAEQVLCGDGLVNVYRACCGADNLAAQFSVPSDVSKAALDGDNAQAVEALQVFCTCLGRVAGDLAIICMARGGVYIAGGIGQKILPFLQKSGFRAAFDDKAPHKAHMRHMPTHVVTHELPALLGLTSFARHPENFTLDLHHRAWRSSK